MKHTLIHLNSSPYSSLACKEGLDLALVLATFEQPVDLCLSGAALSILTSEQSPTIEQGKNLHKLLDGLEFYDIENIFIEKDSSWANTETSWQGVTSLDKIQWQAMFSDYQQVFRF
ncbi:sulfur oxidation protein [Marinomonas ushuaiensis DSM 15871]|uniref:Sulfur oxidation protein n=1 Tax=Marinomonas ushuaiensis DSM 15871 TaxID=1122207 RepID=X7E2T4_9GAMM|nr:DsrE family protein [Marinomonas ushuaiensis]ETX09446.1 sulfur oxidation protein [Marinomonas ushuaiensis DSM 15871]